ncbi:hypothetical protein BD309DRAFT_967453 [Dichomitus squalens]|uniref:Uncharacterized protein n=1 Tax=Dichomitus squalens TaxID=114155 RepID=A0A4V2K858_9APHY|nr:hypothetical protein BD309DRAFT_967453 [Dichomitus squalens]TBU58708.1 hypothetical protein BD310DRAFT_926369 [Dichomitus squalens]
MPRLFGSLGRSSKEGRGYANQYADGYDAPQGYYSSYGFDEQEPRQNSTWRKVFSKKPSKRNYLSRQLQDETAFAPGRNYRTTVEDYPEEQLTRRLRGPLPTDDTESFDELAADPRRSDNIVPLIQRESSLMRIGHAFEDNGTYAPALSAVPSAALPPHQHSVPLYAPQPVPGVQPHVGAVHGMHGPAVVQNMAPPRNNSVRPDIVNHSSSYPERDQPIHRRQERDRSAPPRVKPLKDHPAYWEKPLDRDEEPPVVVVVEYGKNGKKDKYYIIPAGAPVVFEDENGNELTRVGDFSGKYRPPRRPRPVIVQDQYGREICRAGFNNDDHISVGSRSLDSNSYHSESGRSHHRGRPVHRSPHDNQHASREHGSHHGSSLSSSRPYAGPAPDSYLRDPHYQASRRAGTRPSHDDLRGYPADPRPPRSERSAGQSSSDTLVRSSPRRSDDRYGRPRGSDRRDYGSDDRGHTYQREHDSRRNG